MIEELVRRHFPEKDGFCHPDWEAIERDTEGSVAGDELDEFYGKLAQAWLGRLRRKLGGDYRVIESSNFLILTAAPDRVVADAGSFYEHALKAILAELPDVATDEGYGKHVVLMFDDLDDYYSYITYFFPEGDHPMSGGVCLSGEGYRHFALPTLEYASYRTVLVHELTHGCLAHLPLPLWLNEAVAMRMEDALCGTCRLELDIDEYRRHEQFWTEETIQRFWSGESWNIPGDSFELSYDLAQILWRKIEGDLRVSKERVLGFLKSAHWSDAGEAAARESLAVGVGELVEGFLGEGRWTPDPVRWNIEEAEGDERRFCGQGFRRIF